MSIKTSPVFRCLEKKTLVFGFEIADLFLVFSTLGILNFVFGGFPYKILWTWLPSLLLAVALRIAKFRKPEGYLLHLLRYQFTPGVLTAFPHARDRYHFTRQKEEK